MKKVSLILLISVSIACACQKTNKTDNTGTNPNLPSLLSYAKALTVKTDATFSIGGNLGFKTLNSKLLLNVQGCFYDGKKIASGGQLKINNQDYLCNSQGIFSKMAAFTPENNVLGQKVNFKFKSPWNNTASKDTYIMGVDLQMPKEVIVKLPVYDDLFIVNNKLSVGSSVQWIQDETNTKGIIIVIDYDPSSLLNNDFKRNYPRCISNGKIVDDNGNFTLTDDLFTNIPNGVSVSLSLVRVNYEIGTFEDNKTYSIYGYNYKSNDFTFVR